MDNKRQNNFYIGENKDNLMLTRIMKVLQLKNDRKYDPNIEEEKCKDIFLK